LGLLADRLGAARVFLLSAALIGVGMAAVAAGALVGGALSLLIGRGAIASVGPAVIAQSTGSADSVVTPIARMQAWRDLGAAIGPLATGALVSVLGPRTLHGIVAVLVLLSLVWWWHARRA